MRGVSVVNTEVDDAENVTPITNEDIHDDDYDEDEEADESYRFDGKVYATYQDMVNAKRKRNQQVLKDSGLLEVSLKARVSSEVTVDKSTGSRTREVAGLQAKKRKPGDSVLIQRRKSNRLAGLDSDGMYVQDERAGRFSIAVNNAIRNSQVSSGASNGSRLNPTLEIHHYQHRINDGEPLSLQDSMENVEGKWLDESSHSDAERFLGEDVTAALLSKRSRKSLHNSSSPAHAHIVTQGLREKIKLMQSDDSERIAVAKVTPDRIYGITVHPSESTMIVAASDKQGYVGMWKVPDGLNDIVDASSKDARCTHLFRIHKGAASCLQWNDSGSKLLSASYDGTVRVLDVEQQKFVQVFATFDGSSDAFKSQLGYNMDTGSKFWTQYACIDNRFTTDECFFVSTSVGTAIHIDRRMMRATFHEQLSEKKINTLSLHPNGYSFMSAGLDCAVKLWDLRKFQDSRRIQNYKPPSPLVYYNTVKSVNSAFFSPSGRSVVCTTMANKIDILEDVHLASQQMQTKHSIRHDNMTGRWLSTFMATWHPNADIFCVGSMMKPRCVEIYDSQCSLIEMISGEALTSILSRCCFHPSLDKITVIGGNSSGRVAILQ